MKKLLFSILALTAGCTVNLTAMGAALSTQEIKELQGQKKQWNQKQADYYKQLGSRAEDTSVEYNPSLMDGAGSAVGTMNRETAMVSTSRERNEINGMGLKNGEPYNYANDTVEIESKVPTATTAEKEKKIFKEKNKE